jgi:hypothetical protein
VYAPLLLEDGKWSKGIDPKLQSLLSELEAGLSTSIRKKDPSFRGRGDGDDNIGGIPISCLSLTTFSLSFVFNYRNFRTIRCTFI